MPSLYPSIPSLLDSEKEMWTDSGGKKEENEIEIKLMSSASQATNYSRRAVALFLIPFSHTSTLSPLIRK